MSYRCNRLQPSEKCINVQDPNDECCEVQVCDVSSDAHEEPENITIATSSSTTDSVSLTSTTSSTTTPTTTSTTTTTMVSFFEKISEVGTKMSVLRGISMVVTYSKHY